MASTQILLSLVSAGIFLFFIIYFATGISNTNKQIASADGDIMDACMRLLQYSGGTHQCDEKMANYHNSCNTTWKPDYCQDPRPNQYLRSRGYL